MKTTRLVSLLATALAFARHSARAADIDVFAGLPTTSADESQILFPVRHWRQFFGQQHRLSMQHRPANESGNSRRHRNGGQQHILDRTNGGVEQCALYTVLRDLDTTKSPVKIAFMFFNSGMKTFNPTNTSDPFPQECTNGVGGCVGMRMVSLNSTTRPLILEWIRKWDISGNNNYNIKAPANRGDG